VGSELGSMKRKDFSAVTVILQQFN